MDTAAGGQGTRVLLLEDSEIDAELVTAELRKTALGCEVRRVRNRREFDAALAAGDFDIVISDYALPDFDGLSALATLRARLPDTPFIFVSGVVGEEFATDALRRGATDYVLKRNLARLPAALERAMAEARERAERLRAEAALRESEVRLRLAMSAGRLDAWELNPETGVIIWARARGDVTETTYDCFLAHLHDDDRALVHAAIQAAMAPETGSFAVDYRTRRRDGTMCWCTASGQAQFSGGRCTRLFGAVQDITERRAARQAVEQLNDLLARQVRERTRERDRIWHLSRDLLVVCDRDARPVMFNPAWSEQLGWPEDELMRHRLDELIAAEEGGPPLRACLSGIAPTASFESRMRAADGSHRWISWTFVAEESLLYGIGRDVTEARQAAEELAAVNRHLLSQIEERERVEATLRQIQRLEAVGQLTSGVAHDFNNLLTVILGNLTLLERDLAANTRGGTRLRQVRQAAERGAQLTAQLLAFSRRQHLAPKPVNLNDTVLGMRDLLRSTMGGVRLTLDLGQPLWAALVDPTQIELIILNLAINARDAMQAGGTLRIATANACLKRPERAEDPPAGEYVELTVSDTGCGMSEEVLARAFEPFFTTKPVGKGSGLGLAQVFGFAKQSGGGVRIDSQEGVGTHVRVYLPRVATRSGNGEAPKDPAPELPGDELPRTILVVDDDPPVREITATTLRDLGYHVLEAASGGGALDVLSQHPEVALIVADYAMPGMNGADMAHAAQQQRPGLPVLFITGYADTDALRQHCVLSKPFHATDLAERVNALLAAGPLWPGDVAQGEAGPGEPGPEKAQPGNEGSSSAGKGGPGEIGQAVRASA